MSSCATSGASGRDAAQTHSVRREVLASEVRYNPLARRAAGLTPHTDERLSIDDDDDGEEPISRSAAAVRAYYSQKRYASQQAREFVRQQRVIHEFRSERDARERVAAEMSAIRRRIERHEAMRSAGRADPGDTERLYDAQRAAEAMLSGAHAWPRDDASPRSARDPWSEHEAAWLRFEASPPDVITVDTIPWPPDPAQLLHATAAAALARRRSRVPGGGDMSSSSSSRKDAYRAAFRRLALRWHPDKWATKWGSRLQEGPPRAEAQARAREVAQAITTAWAAHTAGGGHSDSD